MHKPSTPSLNWQLMAPIFAVVAIDSIGMGVILPLLPFYAERFGATPAVFGALVASFALCQFVAGPLLGAWSDRVGRRPILIASQAGTCAGFVLLALANSLPLVFLARVITGITSGNLSVASAYAVERSPANARKQAIGVVSAAIGIGLVLGPALSTLTARISPAAPVWLAAAMSAASAIATFILLPADATRPATAAAAAAPPAKHGTFTGPVLAILGLLSCFYVALGMVMGGLALYLAQRFTWHGEPFGAAQVGIVFTGTGIINIFVQLVLMKHLGRLLNDKQLVVASFALLAAGYAATGAVQAVALLGLALAAAAFGSSLLRPTLTSALSVSAPATRQGMVLGVNQSLMAIGNIVGPLLGGVLLTRGSPQGWVAVLVCLYLCGCLAALACFALGLWPATQRDAAPEIPSTPSHKENPHD
ncbi:TPA: MFS transporter [Klebsiella variicola]|nr:MFS transporter [Klebsiella variicola]HBR2062023.1 MFS transporter [Klebsiella variicola]